MWKKCVAWCVVSCSLSVAWATDLGLQYDKGLRAGTADGAYSFRANVLLQPQYQYLAVKGTGDTNSFRVRRARLDLRGSVFHQSLQWRLQNEYTGTAGGGTAHMRDGYLDWQGYTPLQIKVGQYKVPFTREQLSGTTELQFVDRSLVDAVLGMDRDIGLTIHGVLGAKRFEYDLYVMNGDGRNQTNLNDEPIAGARFVVNVLGEHGYRMTDLDDSMAPQLALGAAGAYDFGNAGLSTDDKLIRAVADAAFRWRGFSLLGEGHLVRNTTDQQTDYGFLGQAGYFLMPQRLEIAGRYAGVIRRGTGALEAGGVNSDEITAGLNYYFFKHQVKLQTDYSYLRNNGAVQGQNDHRWRTQAQVLF